MKLSLALAGLFGRSLLASAAGLALGAGAGGYAPEAAAASQHAATQDVGPPSAEQLEARRKLVATLAEQGVQIDLEQGLVGVPASVLVRHDLLEYLLVGPTGAAHEALLATDVTPSVLNAALLALGVAQGNNARWTVRDPPPTPEERADGVAPYTVDPPEGDGFYLYLAWREGDEVYRFRVEDLLSNLETGRAMRRHRWVYIGSRFAQLVPGEPEVFAADVEQNLVNVAWFHAGNTLVTAALPQCRRQDIWIANAWLVPPERSAVQLVFARAELERLPEAWEAELPLVASPAPGDSR